MGEQVQSNASRSLRSRILSLPRPSLVSILSTLSLPLRMIYKSSYPELGPISENTNIYEFIFGTRGSPLDTLALSDDSDRITYRHLHELTTRIGAGWIENAGLEVGDVV